MKHLVAARSAQSNPLLRRAAALAWQRRWWALLSASLQASLAASLLDAKPADGPIEWEPPLALVLEGAAPLPEAGSRLPFN